MVEMLNPVQQSSIANRSKPVPCVVPKKAWIWGKKIHGRKRHLLVDTQGYVLAVKVTGAQRSDQEGGRALLLPLAERLPRMALVWGDSHYGGHFLTWMKVNLGWRMQTVKALTVPKRGI